MANPLKVGKEGSTIPHFQTINKKTYPELVGLYYLSRQPGRIKGGCHILGMQGKQESRVSTNLSTHKQCKEETHFFDPYLNIALD